ncbi:hypothetical protein ACFL50_00135 [Candidatus Latescibacterota bacterium]
MGILWNFYNTANQARACRKTLETHKVSNLPKFGIAHEKRVG